MKKAHRKPSINVIYSYCYLQLTCICCWIFLKRKQKAKKKKKFYTFPCITTLNSTGFYSISVQLNVCIAFWFCLIIVKLQGFQESEDLVHFKTLKLMFYPEQKHQGHLCNVFVMAVAPLSGLIEQLHILPWKRTVLGVVSDINS